MLGREPPGHARGKRSCWEESLLGMLERRRACWGESLLGMLARERTLLGREPPGHARQGEPCWEESFLGMLDREERRGGGWGTPAYALGWVGRTNSGL